MRTSFRLLTLFIGSILLIVNSTAQELYREGAHYEKLPEPVELSTDKPYEVVEVFWYGCPHCFKFEPQVQQWLANKPDDVAFIQMPAILGRNWVIGAHAFYAAEQLGLREKIHQPLFDTIHRDGKHIHTPDELAAFFADFGIDRATFDQAFNAPEVKNEIEQSQKLIRRYQIRGVPALIVNGKYQTSDFQVVDYLIDTDRQTQQ